MRGKWAAGIEPRGFTWVYRGILAVSERPGGSTSVHRRVRRDEELLWLKHQGFGRVISILPVNAEPVHATSSTDSRASHYALRGGPQQRDVLEACYRDLAHCEASRTTVLLHGDEVSDRAARRRRRLPRLVEPARPRHLAGASPCVERLFRRSIGPDGRTVLLDLPEAAAETT